jgi:hypothetical protein
MTPDRSTVPGHGVTVVPKPTLGKRRPLAQYGTAEEIIAVYTPSGEGGDWMPDDFNGAHASIEELLKVNPALTQPERPAPGYETMRALAWFEERFAAIEAGAEGLSLAAGLPMNAVAVDAAEVAAIPTEATLLGLAGAEAGTVILGGFSSGTWEGGAPVVPASERARDLTGLGAPAAAVGLAADALLIHGDAGAAIEERSEWASAAPSLETFEGVADEVADAADDGSGTSIRGGMPLGGGAAAMNLTPEGAVGQEFARAGLGGWGGLPDAAPMPRDVMPGSVHDGGVISGAPVDAADMGGDLQPGFTTGGVAREGGDGGWLAQEESIGGVVGGGHAHGHGKHPASGVPVDAADMGGDLQAGFTTGGVAREGGDGGWLVQEELIEGVVPTEHGHGSGRHRPASGAPVDAADMGGDLQPGFTTGGVAREGGEGGWLAQEELIEGIVAGSGGAVVLEGWDGPIPDGAMVATGGRVCPDDYPIKGNLPSRFYHLPADFAYAATNPEFCFNHERAALAAGFTHAPQRGEGGLQALRAAAQGGGTPPVPSGAVRAGDKSCPANHPIKGNLQSGYYHRPQDPSYNVTIPEFCFASEPEARAAGFTLAGTAKRD